MVRSFRFEMYRDPSGLLRWRLLVGKQVVAGSTRASAAAATAKTPSTSSASSPTPPSSTWPADPVPCSSPRVHRNMILRALPQAPLCC